MSEQFKKQTGDNRFYEKLLVDERSSAEMLAITLIRNEYAVWAETVYDTSGNEAHYHICYCRPDVLANHILDRCCAVNPSTRLLCIRDNGHSGLCVDNTGFTFQFEDRVKHP